GRSIADFHVDAPAIEDILDRLKRRETLRNYEARLRCKDGTIRDVLISSNVRWNKDEFVHTRCFTRDISERKRYEQRLLTQYAVGQVLASEASVEAAAPRILETIAGQLAWQVGALWTPQKDEQVLRCQTHWERISAPASGFAA